MKALLWKDFRVYRPVIVANLLLMALPYVLVLFVAIARRRSETERDIVERLLGASLSAFALTCIFGCVYGAGAFALERSERSLDFMTVLPVSRIQIILSKLLVAGCSILLLQLLCFILASFLLTMSEHVNREWRGDYSRILLITESGALMLFAISWLCSTFLRSIAVSAGVAIVLVAAVSMTIWLIADRLDLFDYQREALATQAQIAITFVTGIVALVGSSIYYLRRVEP